MGEGLGDRRRGQWAWGLRWRGGGDPWPGPRGRSIDQTSRRRQQQHQQGQQQPWGPAYLVHRVEGLNLPVAAAGARGLVGWVVYAPAPVYARRRPACFKRGESGQTWLAPGSARRIHSYVMHAFTGRSAGWLRCVDRSTARQGAEPSSNHRIIPSSLKVGPRSEQHLRRRRTHAWADAFEPLVASSLGFDLIGVSTALL